MISVVAWSTLELDIVSIYVLFVELAVNHREPHVLTHSFPTLRSSYLVSQQRPEQGQRKADPQPSHDLGHGGGNQHIHGPLPRCQSVGAYGAQIDRANIAQIGRASCRERVCQYV